MDDRKEREQPANFRRLGIHLLISLNEGIDVAVRNDEDPEEYAGYAAASYIAAAVRHPEWAMGVVTMLEEIAPDGTELYAAIVKCMPVHGRDVAAPRLSGGFEWMHDLGFGALDGEEERDGQRQTTVRRTQPEATENEHAAVAHAGSPAKNTHGDVAANEGGSQS